MAPIIIIIAPFYWVLYLNSFTSSYIRDVLFHFYKERNSGRDKKSHLPELSPNHAVKLGLWLDLWMTLSWSSLHCFIQLPVGLGGEAGDSKTGLSPELVGIGVNMC